MEKRMQVAQMVIEDLAQMEGASDTLRLLVPTEQYNATISADLDKDTVCDIMQQSGSMLRPQGLVVEEVVRGMGSKMRAGSKERLGSKGRSGSKDRPGSKEG